MTTAQSAGGVGKMLVDHPQSTGSWFPAGSVMAKSSLGSKDCGASKC